ncbi:MAG: hypothetical protein Q7S04_03710 [Candidatus Moranbacteria bacterium]|nr:hypothetical protein [Candidatus Moranbacteria bacterium]
MDSTKEEVHSIETFVKGRKLDMGFLLAGVLLGIFFSWNIVEIAIFAVFIWSIIGPIQSRYLAWPALFFLAFTPILLTLGRKVQAEEFAIYAYYFLVMAVIRGIIEVRSESDDDTQTSEKP